MVFRVNDKEFYHHKDKHKSQISSCQLPAIWLRDQAMYVHGVVVKEAF